MLLCASRAINAFWEVFEPPWWDSAELDQPLWLTVGEIPQQKEAWGSQGQPLHAPDSIFKVEECAFLSIIITRAFREEALCLPQHMWMP